MGQDTKIEWANHTFNPWWGCTKVSPGCAHCYAEGVAARFGKDVWGKGKARSRTSAANWRQPLKWNKGAAEMRNFPVHRPRVFCGSMCDVLDPEVPVEWLADLLDLIRRTPYLDWLLLTKRPELWRELISMVYHVSRIRRNQELADWVEAWADKGNPPANVWMGTSVEDQKRADERIPALLKIPARVRFLSCEPLLGEVDLIRHCNHEAGPHQRFRPVGCVDWVIVGGESGPQARPMHPDWARSLRDQCQAAGVAFFFKQWGAWGASLAEIQEEPYVNRFTSCADGRGVGFTVNQNPQFLNWRTGETGRISASHGDVCSWKMGKKPAGRLLDGRAWNGFPEGKAATDGRDGR